MRSGLLLWSQCLCVGAGCVCFRAWSFWIRRQANKRDKLVESKHLQTWREFAACSNGAASVKGCVLVCEVVSLFHNSNESLQCFVEVGIENETAAVQLPLHMIHRDHGDHDQDRPDFDWFSRFSFQARAVKNRLLSRFSLSIFVKWKCCLYIYSPTKLCYFKWFYWRG